MQLLIDAIAGMVVGNSLSLFLWYRVVHRRTCARYTFTTYTSGHIWRGPDQKWLPPSMLTIVLQMYWEAQRQGKPFPPGADLRALMELLPSGYRDGAAAPSAEQSSGIH